MIRHRLHVGSPPGASAPSGGVSAGFRRAGGRTDLRRTVEWRAAARLSLLIEAGSKLNWAARSVRWTSFLLRAENTGWDRIVSMAGGVGRRRRIDAIRLSDSSCIISATSSPSKAGQKDY
jgi:hypothetical protein